WAAALGARAGEALVERVDREAGELAAGEAAGHRHAFPELGMRHVPLLAAPGAGVEEIGRCRIFPKIEAGIGLGREYRHGLVCENEIAERIEDRPALVELDPERRVRAMG